MFQHMLCDEDESHGILNHETIRGCRGRNINNVSLCLMLAMQSSEIRNREKTIAIIDATAACDKLSATSCY